MLWFFSWYLTVTLIGWLSFPIAFRLFPALSDRGYSLSRALGLLLWGYIFWLFTSLGLSQNNIGGLLLGLLTLIGLSAWAAQVITPARRGEKDRQNNLYPLISWIRQNRNLILTLEILFLLAFAFLAFVRASNPELESAEKPMELMFINSIMRSPTFPPRDAWLSGYGISYYYFGYVMTAMLARLTGVPGSAAHNLMTALIFALGAIGSYGILFNLLSLRKRSNEIKRTEPILRRSFLAPLFLLLVSNAEGFLEILHRQELFWTKDTSPFWKWLKNIDVWEMIWTPDVEVYNFWTWLNIKELNGPPPPLPGILCERFVHWWDLEIINCIGKWFSEQFEPSRYLWWWRASRVISDYDLGGGYKEIIDEFPFFSFLHADLHPHVLAIPFGLLSIAIALNLFLGGWKSSSNEWIFSSNKQTWAWISVIICIAGIAFLSFSISNLIKFIVSFSSETINFNNLSNAIIFGILTFITIWIANYILVSFADFNSYGIDVFKNNNYGTKNISIPLNVSRVGLFFMALVLGGLAFLNTWDILISATLIVGAYVLTRVIEKGWSWTQIEDVFVFGIPLGFLSILLYLPFYIGFSSQLGGILPNLVYPTRGAHLWVMFAPLLLVIYTYLIYLKFGKNLPGKWLLAALLSLVLVLVLWGISWLLGLGTLLFDPDLGGFFMEMQNVSSIGELFVQAGLKRVVRIGGALTILAVLLPPMAFLIAIHKSMFKGSKVVIRSHQSNIFILLLIILGALLVFGPEFLYLRDQFGTRINTVFKFYYQAWILWSLASAYGVAVLLKKMRWYMNLIFTALLIIVLVVGLTYPVFGILKRTNAFNLNLADTLRQSIQNTNDSESRKMLQDELASVWTLDYFEKIQRRTPDEADAIRWLQNAPDGVVVEAIGGSYSGYARISTYTGLPTVLGWPGHESQWRGGYEKQGSRQSDVESLYATDDWYRANEIIARYNIRYIYVGNLERGKPLHEEKFNRHLLVTFRQGNVTIYEVP